MSKFIELSPSNFDQIFENRILAVADKTAEELTERYGVNPTLDGLVAGGEDFAESLFQDVACGRKRVAVPEDCHDSDGLVVVTSRVKVKELTLGKKVIAGACVEAVCTSVDKHDLADYYRFGTDLASKYYEPKNIFAIEKRKIIRDAENIFASNPRASQALRNAIAKALPLLDSAGRYARSDNPVQANDPTEILYLKLSR